MPEHIIHASKGSELHCKGWHQEAAMRMLMNNLDPEVAEDPDKLIVYGGTGKAARNWDCYDAIVRTLKELENDETLLVQSGKPVGVFYPGHPHAGAYRDRLHGRRVVCLCAVTPGVDEPAAGVAVQAVRL